jgi:molybdopterin converting factor small subunit
MALLRLFGPAREAAGIAEVVLPGQNVSAIMTAAIALFGEPFSEILATSNVWLNGDPVQPDVRVGEGDEVAVIPPVSGG